MKFFKVLFVIFLAQAIALSASATTFYSINLAITAFAISSQSRHLKTTVVEDALTAYNCALMKGVADPKQIITIVDYSLPNSMKRLWVIDLHSRKVLVRV